jgi:hypothetical protein
MKKLRFRFCMNFEIPSMIGGDHFAFFKADLISLRTVLDFNAIRYYRPTTVSLQPTRKRYPSNMIQETRKFTPHHVRSMQKVRNPTPST